VFLPPESHETEKNKLQVKTISETCHSISYHHHPSTGKKKPHGDRIYFINKTDFQV
jgi:hypothetical protein